jgi:hypothetical protein
LPELDPDLVRIIALGLLGVLVLLLVAILGSLGRLRKSIEATAAARPEPSPVAEEPRPETVGAAPAAMEAAPEPLETTPSPAAAPERVVQEPEPVAQEPEPVVQEPVAQEPEPVMQEPAPVVEEPLAQEPEPVAQEPTPTQEQPAVQEQQPAAAVAVDEPQEQPFERDGRWWFRRGEELLVYNDASGQWEPAPSQTAPAVGQASTTTSVGTEQAPAQTQEQQGFWKCPSCGAVNGSTATTCRMCFSARP